MIMHFFLSVEENPGKPGFLFCGVIIEGTGLDAKNPC
jgi:hypothetical protein